MAHMQSCMQDHERDYERSKKRLTSTRVEAMRTRVAGYDSDATRAKLRSEFTRITKGLEAYDWQIDTAEAILLGLDCSVIASTGAGKTMPFVMPLFIEKDKRVIIISPLNALEEDQAKRFNEMGLNAVAVNGDTWTGEIHKSIADHKFNVIITSPEMALKHAALRSLLSCPKLAGKTLAIIIDEAHCISQWGEKFRPLYEQLGTLHAFVPAKVPFLATSATLQPPVLAQVQKVLHMNPLESFNVNVGIDRPNIAWFVHRMKARKSDLDALNFVLRKDLAKDEITELVQTMVFFDDINVLLEAQKHLCSCLPPQLRGQIVVYHSRHSSKSKCHVMEEFRQGINKILLTTEAAGMGCDLPHIQRVVQFMVPNSLAIWLQRAGRAARSHLIRGKAFLLVQPTVFQEHKKKGDDNEVTYRKDVEPGLRLWIETVECRREVGAEYFNDGLAHSEPTGLCCDNCLRKLNPSHHLLRTENIAPACPPSPGSDTEECPTSEPSANGKRPLAPSAKVSNRRGDHLARARKLLTRWRDDTFERCYEDQPWGAPTLLPPATLTSIATKARLQSIDDFIAAGWEETFALQHGFEVIELLSQLDHDVATEILARVEARGQERAAKRAEIERMKEEEKEVKRLQKEAKAKEAKESRERKQRVKAAEKVRKAEEQALTTPRPRGRPRKILRSPLSSKNRYSTSIASTPTASDPEATQNTPAIPAPGSSLSASAPVSTPLLDNPYLHMSVYSPLPYNLPTMPLPLQYNPNISTPTNFHFSSVPSSTFYAPFPLPFAAQTTSPSRSSTDTQNSSNT